MNPILILLPMLCSAMLVEDAGWTKVGRGAVPEVVLKRMEQRRVEKARREKEQNALVDIQTGLEILFNYLLEDRSTARMVHNRFHYMYLRPRNILFHVQKVLSPVLVNVDFAKLVGEAVQRQKEAKFAEEETDKDSSDDGLLYRMTHADYYDEDVSGQLYQVLTALESSIAASLYLSLAQSPSRAEFAKRAVAVETLVPGMAPRQTYGNKQVIFHLARDLLQQAVNSIL